MGFFTPKAMRLSSSPWLLRPVILAATGFGLGLSPVASGTFGSLLGVAIVFGAARLGIICISHQIILAAGLALLAVPICHVAERHFGQKDDGRIVADEYLTFPICMIGLPLTPWILALAFVTNRCFDIIKPPPANSLQRLRGGMGIVLDDVASSLYSLVANHVIVGIVIWMMS